MTSIVLYKGNLRTELTHLQSGTLIENDAPTDNQGKGERFSPTDLVATALGSCMITTMGIKANTMNIDLTGTKAEITKIMKSDPRRIGKIITHIIFPTSLQQLDEKQKQILENTARTCPVARSLHPDLETDIQFTWE
ncbi:MAG: OsmC family peroxiredoxin [Hydrotalea flava]|uniref:OsmC family protein n=2 Tax=Chitinophagaceae TaxID=563835 RepID=UPI000944B9D3|nr:MULTISPECIES: OsmC family protein [Hydrotalea]MBY0347561.1 OsmC family protein [Hydrotalea flava]NIM36021.1 OsmC family peroxiredoxin [Hydrotalea flava]NIM38868.1 OsmC family peroxiredoxin [Hydrotalea flava]NIN04058.1 OsmC family peroxiredoxin [Hydrotalea flava]NIN15763.1 OsmC family peroxiredoxin [Hydrotalea flava]